MTKIHRLTSVPAEEEPARQFGHGSFAWMSRTLVPRFTIHANASRNNPPGSRRNRIEERKELW